MICHCKKTLILCIFLKYFHNYDQKKVYEDLKNTKRFLLNKYYIKYESSYILII